MIPLFFESVPEGYWPLLLLQPDKTRANASQVLATAIRPDKPRLACAPPQELVSSVEGGVLRPESFVISPVRAAAGHCASAGQSPNGIQTSSRSTSEPKRLPL